MGSNSKYYVVWEGFAPGVYENWEECQQQILGYPGAKYKSFDSAAAAIEAFRGSPDEHLKFAKALSRHLHGPVDYTKFPEIRLDAIAVDGACAGNPGPMEYRCVRVADGMEIFHVGPIEGGTNNIAEYLALIHAAALLKSRNLTNVPIYSDSRTALSWLRRGKSNTTVLANEENTTVIDMLNRADKWLATNTIANPILKWDTDRWGEIPADFGRK